MASLPGEPRTLLVVIAHPDDESFGCGALIASAAARGDQVVVCCASRGELGEDATGCHAAAGLGPARERELRAAAGMLGVTEVTLLGFGDSGWDGDPPAGSIVAEPVPLRESIETILRRCRPDIVVTMDPDGSDGHRDHAAVGRAASDAFERVVDWPASLYHWCLPRSLMAAWSREIAGEEPGSVYLETDLGRDDGDITTILDGAHVVDRVWRAIAAHHTQASPYAAVSPGLAERFVRYDHLIRRIPRWDGGPDGPPEAELHPHVPSTTPSGTA